MKSATVHATHEKYEAAEATVTAAPGGGTGSRRNSLEILALGILNLLEARSKKDKTLFNPNGKFCTQWDPLMFMLLIFITFATPFEIAFIADTKVNFMFVLNKVIDVIFCVDILVNFNMIYKDAEGSMINDRYRIAARYFRSWFIIDFVSIIPFDLIALFHTDDGASSASSSATNLKMIRLVKLLRLLKLLRVLKSSRIIRRWEAQMGMSYAKLTVLSFTVFLGTAVHWTACVWRLAPTVFHDEDDNNWLKQYNGIDQESTNMQYSASVYASISLLLSGGMPSDIDPTSPAEQLVVGFLTIFTAILYVYLIGSITAVLESMDQPTKMFRQNMDNLNQFCEERNLSSKLRVRLRGYLRSAQHVCRDKFYAEMLQTLSPMLQGEVTMATHEAWISTLNFLEDVDQEEKRNFSIMLSSILHSKCFAQKEYIIREGELCTRMFIIQKGIMAVCGNVVGKGGYVGHDVVIAVAGFHWRRHYNSTALTFVDVHIIESDDLSDLLSSGDFVDITRKLRKRAIRLVTSRLIVKASKHPQMVKQLEKMREEKMKYSEKFGCASKRSTTLQPLQVGDPVANLREAMQSMVLQQQQTAAHVERVVVQQKALVHQMNFIAAHLGVPAQAKSLVPIAKPATTPQGPSGLWWYWDEDDNLGRNALDIAQGSFTFAQLRAMHSSQELSARTPVWTRRLGQDERGQPNWKPLAVALREEFLKETERNLTR